MVGNSQTVDNDSQNFEEMLEESFKKIGRGSRVKGTVVGITPTEVYVDVGRKQAGFIPLSELSTEPNAKTSDIVKIGDELDLLIMRTDDQEGTIMLSKNRVDSASNWDELIEMSQNNTILKGTVKEVVKGGIIVSYKKNKVFIPSSHVGGSRSTPFEEYINKEVSFRIIEVNKSRKRIVGSIKSVIEDDKKKKLEEFWNNIEIGKSYTGTVRSITDYGAFVDLGCIDGMIYISDISWDRIDKPSDILSVGQEVEVRVKSFDKDKGKIALTYKKEEDSPWEKIKRDYPVGKVFEAEIVNIVPYGAFAKVLPGIDGLIHISQIADHRIESPKEVLSVGDVVKVKVREVNLDAKRINLTMKGIEE